MKKIFLISMIVLSSILLFWNSFWGEVEDVLSNVAENRVGNNISSTNVKEFLKDIGLNIMRPIIIVIWLLIAFIGFYKLAFSDKEDERKTAINYILWWTIWVIIMVSAWFLVDQLVWDSWSSWILWLQNDDDPLNIADKLYDNIVKKFFVLAMYFVVWILFVILVINLIKFLSSWDKENMNKHTKTIVIWNSIWIVIIIFAKNIVKMFHSKMTNGNANTNVILAEKDNALLWLSTFLNYLLWFIAFIITIFIIYQSFLLLMKPDDEWTYKSLKKYFLYAILWVFLIWGVYIIANFFIIN